MPGAHIWTGLSAKSVANYFLQLGWRDGIPIDPLKLQKLIYVAHGWSLALFNRPLIKEPIEAWRYGPAVGTLYKAFERFGGSPITEFANKEPSEAAYGIDPETVSILDAVWGRYKSLSPYQLSILAHEPGGAWDVTMRNRARWTSPWASLVIPNELIAQEFLRKQQQDR